MNGLYDLYKFQTNLQILDEKVKSAAQQSLKKEEALRLRRDQINLEQGMIALTDTKKGERSDTPMNETVQSTLKAIEEKGPYFF